MSKPNLSRRIVLKGVGAAMALPWLESMNVWGSDESSSSSSSSPSEIPKRFAVQFMACGVNYKHWWAKGEGGEMELGPSLEPMTPHRSKMNIVNGLFNQSAVGVGIHPGQTGNILSGASLKKGAELRGGISIDQRIANAVGTQTAQPSIVLGCEQPTTGYHETNFSMAYSSHISWQDATSPVPMEVYPSLAFDSLFNNRGNRRNQSVLDRVSEHATDLSRRVSSADKTKLDEYMTSVREVEKRIERARDDEQTAGQRAADHGKPIAMMPRPDNGLPEDIREHMRLMCDLVAIAFQTDKTRVASLLMCRDISGLLYPFLNVRSAHHGASHSDTDDEYLRITQYYVSQFAYLISKLDAMPEGDGTVLDNSCLMFINNMWSGNQHDSSKVPLILAGGLQGQMPTGRVLDFGGRADEDRKLCSLYLSIMNKMGIDDTHFGDADTTLALA